MEIKINGISFASKAKQEVATMRPEGSVTLVPEPENKYDKYAISVRKDGLHIGYIPSGYIQNWIVENEISDGIVTGYLYSPDAGNTFNENHDGILYSVTIKFGENLEDCSPVGYAKYMRATSFLKYFDAYGGGDGLIKWAFEQGNTYDEYREHLDGLAEAGTNMHSAIEAFLSEGSRGSELPRGWDAFVKKYDPEPVIMEQRVYDDVLAVCGQFDFLGYITIKGVRVLAIVDWKSSKAPSFTHKLQLALYAKNARWDNQQPTFGLCVAFGADNKQGFSAAGVDHEKLESMYVGLTFVKKAMDAMGVYIQPNKLFIRGELEAQPVEGSETPQ